MIRVFCDNPYCRTECHGTMDERRIRFVHSEEQDRVFCRDCYGKILDVVGLDFIAK